MQEISKGGLPGASEQESIMDGLELFISLGPEGREEEAE